MSDKIPRDVLNDIERCVPTGLDVNRDPNSSNDTVRVVGYQRSEDSERRDENRDKLDALRRDLDWGDKDDEWPVEVVDVGEVESRYSQVILRVEVSY